MDIERRRHIRYETAWPVTVTASDRTWVGEIKNISPVGALVHCCQRPDQKELLRIKIELPNTVSVVSATARVVHCHVQEGENKHASYRLGIHFLDMSAKNRVLILNAVSSCSLN